MKLKCGLSNFLVLTILVIIVRGYAKDISGVERGHNRLNEYISHYETLNYDHKHIRASHNRAKRSVTKDHIVHIKFSAHGKDFHLRLKRDLNTFSDKLEVYDSKGPIDVSTDHIYEGNVIGERNSYVFGSILDGIFEGKIITEREAYYVEHAKRYFPTQKTTTTTTVTATNRTLQPMSQRRTIVTSKDVGADGKIIDNDGDNFNDDGDVNARENVPKAEAVVGNIKGETAATTTTKPKTTATLHTENLTHRSKTSAAAEAQNTQEDQKHVHGDFHSVIYKESHVDDAYKDIREGAHVGGCGITEEVSQWMESIQNSAVEELPEPMSKNEFSKQQQQQKNQKLQQKRTTTTSSITNLNNHNHHPNHNHDNLNKNVDNKVEKGGKTATATAAGAAAAPTTTTINTTKTVDSKTISINSEVPSGGDAAAILIKYKKDIENKNNSNIKKSMPFTLPLYGNGADDDFKYPFEKYTEDANYRFAEIPATSNSRDSNSRIGGGAASENYIGLGNFYNPETGRKISPTDNNWHARVHERMRRASGSSGPSNRREDNKNTCSLYIQTDPLIWRHIREGIADHDRGRKYEIDVKTREEITSLIAHHVTAVNYIYRNTKFDGRTEHRNIRFEVQRIKIDDDSACRSSYNGPHNAFCNEHMDVSNFLNLHSLEDHSDFCLAYVFTYRDFTGGTLGLAWVASASGASGGICEKYKTYTETVGGQYQSTKRSLNTGIITFVNYNSRVPPKVSQLTLAHEIGHNFGSPHDFPQECRPGGLNGNYIMFASATSGDRPNNSKFSPCSIRNISNVLDVLVGNVKRDCFKVSEGAFCGNKIVESGEECDCGFNEEECKDNCCYPRLISEYDLSLNSTAKGCTRRAKTQCSPSQGPCCLANACTFVPTNYHQKCKEETECSWSSTCNGTTAECPEPKPRDDKTKCNNGTALCIRGECSGSICLLWNMTECFLTSQMVPHVDKRKLCELACQNGNDTGTCRSTSEFAHLFELPPGGISLRPGSPCDNFQGYCDVFLKCRAVDADGPLVRLKNLLLNRETLHTVAQWITENWYIVVLMGIGFILFMGIFIKCCAVHTPSSNPKKRRARRISETLRAPMNTLRRMRHPHHGRGAGPRCIPPPMHDQRSHAHHRSHMTEWDRRDPHGGGGGRGGGAGVSAVVASGQAIVALPPASGSHATRSVSGSGRPPGGGRSSRAINPAAGGSRQTNNSRTGHGYAETPPTAALLRPVGHAGHVGQVGVGTGMNADPSFRHK